MHSSHDWGGRFEHRVRDGGRGLGGMEESDKREELKGKRRTSERWMIPMKGLWRRCAQTEK